MAVESRHEANHECITFRERVPHNNSDPEIEAVNEFLNKCWPF